MMAPIRYMMTPLWRKLPAKGIREFALPKKSPQQDCLLGRFLQSSVLAELPAHFHGLAFSHIGEKGDLASAVDLQGKLPLMFRTQTRCSLGKNLSQTIHELLQLCGPLIVERELLLTDSAFSLSTMKHT